MNENQKKVTDEYRSNYEAIFGKKKEPVIAVEAKERVYKAEFKTLADPAFKSIVEKGIE